MLLRRKKRREGRGASENGPEHKEGEGEERKAFYCLHERVFGLLVRYEQ